MIKVFSAKNSLEAHFLRGLLQSEGIEAVVQGQHLENLQGMIPFGVSSACTVWILNPQDLKLAKQIISETTLPKPTT